MNVLNCQLEKPVENADKSMTVGQIFMLSCDGQMNAAMKPSVQFEFKDEKEKYKIHVLELKESTAQHIKLIVTSYRPGEYMSEQLTLTDGDNVVQTNELSWVVSSVLSQNEEAKPVPSKGPLELSYPLWFWLMLALAVASLLGLLFYFINRVQKRKRLREELLKYRTVLSPFAQYSKDMRQVQKMLQSTNNNSHHIEIVKKIENTFRLYLIRELVIPALKVKDRELLRVIKREDAKLYEICNSHLRKLFLEFSKAQNNLSKIDERGLEGLLVLSRRTAEKIMDYRKKHK